MLSFSIKRVRENKMDVDIVCLGEPLIELNQSSNDGKYLSGFGGDVSNCAVAAARQGAKVGMITALGHDVFGRSFLDLWKAENIDCKQVEVSDTAHTGIYFVTHGKDGHEFSYMRKGSAASLYGVSNLPNDYIAHAKVLHTSGISQAISATACDAVFEAINIAKKNQTLVSYDTNLRLKLWPIARARAIIHETIGLSDIILPGYDDAVDLTGLKKSEDIIKFYQDLGAKIIALTLGEKGVLVAANNEVKFIEGIKVKAVDATGAGDTFDGAFLSQIIKGVDPFSAAIYANAAAALAVQGYGAVAPMPTHEQVSTLLN